MKWTPPAHDGIAMCQSGMDWIWRRMCFRYTAQAGRSTGIFCDLTGPGIPSWRHADDGAIVGED